MKELAPIPALPRYAEEGDEFPALPRSAREAENT
jgi:hypothetical protein